MAITVDYSRVPGFPQEQLAREGIRVTDKLQCAWTDRVTLAKELLGFAVGGILHTPHQYDAGNDPLNNLYAMDVDIEPLIGLNQSTGEYTKAVLTVNYETPEYSIDDAGESESTTYVTESLEPSTEFLTLDNTWLYWSDDTSLESSESPSVLIRMMDWVYQVHQVPSLPNNFFDYIGYVNSTNVYSRSFGRFFPVETLLYGNPSLHRTYTSEGISAWDVTYRFTYRNNGTFDSPKGWNYFPRPDSIDASNAIVFEAVYKATGGASSNRVKPYPTAEFNNIVS